MCCGKLPNAEKTRIEFVISSAQDIRLLLPDIGLFKERSKKIIARFEHLSPDQNQRLEKQITAYYEACGCG